MWKTKLKSKQLLLPLLTKQRYPIRIYNTTVLFTEPVKAYGARRKTIWNLHNVQDRSTQFPMHIFLLVFPLWCPFTGYVTVSCSLCQWTCHENYVQHWCFLFWLNCFTTVCCIKMSRIDIFFPINTLVHMCIDSLSTFLLAPNVYNTMATNIFTYNFAPDYQTY